MLIELAAPALAALALLACATAVGAPAMRKLITVYEAKHELKHGSAGWLRSIRGWSMVAFWAMTTWFIATIIGDWAVNGDLGAAIDRGWLRLRILLEIAMAIMESD
ncbi:hypothetical protein GCM10007385_33920 [Tateyamaria omphalii]|uniref:hypothetical protein n=1 Tax=Tateyamaria omphalii TaxID=299262 RepID=UPI0016777497|nr:hypothetical protein [Tateyamaria omphalii]GGX62039.1 hypothetical protein GCM10007385_33920 [Tateyamaria omphalii]